MLPEQTSQIQPGEIFRALAVFVEPPSPEHEPVARTLDLGALPSRADHTDLFDFQLFPYASVYLGPEGMQGGEARDRIAGFWRVLELEPPNDPDHLTVLLAAYGALLDQAEAAPEADAENWLHVSSVFLHEHVLSWLPLFLAKLDAAGGEFYARWAGHLQNLLAVPELGPVADKLPAALREAEPLPDPRQEGGKAFLHGLLAPARTGFILTRDDLAGIARNCDLGRRIGERRYVLENLLGQDGRPVLSALAEFADTAGEGDLTGMPEVSADWWRARARSSRDLLHALAADADGYSSA